MRFSTRPSWLTVALFLHCLATGCGDERVRLAEICDRDERDACHELGELEIHGIDGPMKRKSGRLHLERACELGRADSCRIAGGLSYGKRDARARRYLELGCEGGGAESCVDLGWMIEHGDGGDADPQAGERLYERACEAGEPAGCFLLGLRWRPPPGGRGDPVEMRRYFGRACDLGYRFACQRAGR